MRDTHAGTHTWLLRGHSSYLSRSSVYLVMVGGGKRERERNAHAEHYAKDVGFERHREIHPPNTERRRPQDLDGEANVKHRPSSRPQTISVKQAGHIYTYMHAYTHSTHPYIYYSGMLYVQTKHASILYPEASEGRLTGSPP